MLFGRVERAARYTARLRVGSSTFDLFKTVTTHTGPTGRRRGSLRGVADFLRRQRPGQPTIARTLRRRGVHADSSPRRPRRTPASLADSSACSWTRPRSGSTTRLSVNVTALDRRRGWSRGQPADRHPRPRCGCGDVLGIKVRSGANQVRCFSERTRRLASELRSPARAGRRADGPGQAGPVAAGTGAGATLDPYPKPPWPRVSDDRDAVGGHGPPDGPPRTRGRPRPAGRPAPRRRQAGASGGDPREAVRAHRDRMAVGRAAPSNRPR